MSTTKSFQGRSRGSATSLLPRHRSRQSPSSPIYDLDSRTLAKAIIKTMPHAGAAHRIFHFIVSTGTTGSMFLNISDKKLKRVLAEGDQQLFSQLKDFREQPQQYYEDLFSRLCSSMPNTPHPPWRLLQTPANPVVAETTTSGAHVIQEGSNVVPEVLSQHPQVTTSAENARSPIAVMQVQSDAGIILPPTGVLALQPNSLGLHLDSQVPRTDLDALDVDPGCGQAADDITEDVAHHLSEEDTQDMTSSVISHPPRSDNPGIEGTPIFDQSLNDADRNIQNNTPSLPTSPSLHLLPLLYDDWAEYDIIIISPITTTIDAVGPLSDNDLEPGDSQHTSPPLSPGQGNSSTLFGQQSHPPAIPPEDNATQDVIPPVSSTAQLPSPSESHIEHESQDNFTPDPVLERDVRAQPTGASSPDSPRSPEMEEKPSPAVQETLESAPLDVTSQPVVDEIGNTTEDAILENEQPDSANRIDEVDDAKSVDNTHTTTTSGSVVANLEDPTTYFGDCALGAQGEQMGHIGDVDCAKDLDSPNATQVVSEPHDFMEGGDPVPGFTMSMTNDDENIGLTEDSYDSDGTDQAGVVTAGQLSGSTYESPSSADESEGSHGSGVRKPLSSSVIVDDTMIIAVPPDDSSGKPDVLKLTDFFDDISDLMPQSPVLVPSPYFLFPPIPLPHVHLLVPGQESTPVLRFPVDAEGSLIQAPPNSEVRGSTAIHDASTSEVTLEVQNIFNLSPSFSPAVSSSWSTLATDAISPRLYLMEPMSPEVKLYNYSDGEPQFVAFAFVEEQDDDEFMTSTPFRIPGALPSDVRRIGGLYPDAGTQASFQSDAAGSVNHEPTLEVGESSDCGENDGRSSPLQSASPATDIDVNNDIFPQNQLGLSVVQRPALTKRESTASMISESADSNLEYADATLVESNLQGGPFSSSSGRQTLSLIPPLTITTSFLEDISPSLDEIFSASSATAINSAPPSPERSRPQYSKWTTGSRTLWPPSDHISDGAVVQQKKKKGYNDVGIQTDLESPGNLRQIYNTSNDWSPSHILSPLSWFRRLRGDGKDVSGESEGSTQPRLAIGERGIQPNFQGPITALAAQDDDQDDGL